MTGAVDPPAGWYPDPEAPEDMRWWDGATWSDHRRPGVPPQAILPSPVPSPSAVEAGTPKSGGFGCVVVFLVAVLAAVFLFQLWNSTQSSGSRNDDAPTAEVACEKLVKQNLKSPSTAHFDSQQQMPANLSGTYRA